MRLSHRAFGCVAIALASLSVHAAGCKDKSQSGPSKDGIFALGDVPALSKTEGAVELPETPETTPREGGPRLGAVEFVAPIYQEPDRRSDKVGYLRAGGTLVRADKPVKTDDCAGGWYRVLPTGYVCATNEATTDVEHPILRALTLRPDVSKPLPYPYAFVRAIAPNYYRVPTKEEQLQYEMSLDRHLRSYKKLHEKWDALEIGSNDLELDAEGNVVGLPPDEPPALDYNAVYGGNGSDEVPWFFQGGRKIPNIATFKVPEYAVITNRIPRKGMLALIGTFVGPNDRRFALTTDARLVPTSKLKPERGSTFHGVSLKKGWHLPLAFVKRDGAYAYDVSKASLEKNGKAHRLDPIQLTGQSKHLGGHRLVESIDGNWYREHDVAIAAKPSKLPAFAKDGKRWIDIGIQSQTLILYEGNRAVYATAVSTGRDGLGDPKKTLSTPTGTFDIREKHVTATMDANEVDNKFELRDVPWVQYFKGGYALHAAPWHDEFGRPRSHGCVNLSPLDARRVFLFTTPMLPVDWHGVNASKSTSEGTTIYIHP
ncbi:MAG: L,D-transpeptidase [Polyangiaceae bacterium]|nr:L,D-transpeptidase [Polyangiaceae bacterium]